MMVTHPSLTAQQDDTPRCQHCGHPLTARASIVRLAGPICLRRTTIGAPA